MVVWFSKISKFLYNMNRGKVAPKENRNISMAQGIFCFTQTCSKRNSCDYYHFLISDFTFTFLMFAALVDAGIKTDSFCHQGTYYQVETRTRMIFFNMGLFEAPSALQRKPSSLISHSADQPKPLSREHGGLMSWPEHFYKQRQHHQHPDGIDSQVDSLFARATQLSVFGSMVCGSNLSQHIGFYDFNFQSLFLLILGVKI